MATDRAGWIRVCIDGHRLQWDWMVLGWQEGDGDNDFCSESLVAGSILLKLARYPANLLVIEQDRKWGIF